MKTNEKISVVVPVYNVEKYIKKCINSLINQTYSNLEIILVDDGSTDNSGFLCDKLSNIDNRIKVFHKKNGGLSDARNFGIKHAHGKYIAFVDSDDYIDEKMYEILYNNLVKQNADISICGKIIEYENSIQKAVYDNKIDIFNRDEALIQLNYLELFDMSACDKLFKIELFDNLQFPFGMKNEDLYVMYKIFYKTSKVVYSYSKLYHYIQRASSITKQKNIDEYYINACLEQKSFFEKNCSNIVFAADVMLTLAYIFQYNRYIYYGVKCPKKTLINYRKFARRNKKYILNNKQFSKKRKLQVIMFCYFTLLYKYMLKLKKKNAYKKIK